MTLSQTLNKRLTRSDFQSGISHLKKSAIKLDGLNIIISNFISEIPSSYL